MVATNRKYIRGSETRISVHSNVKFKEYNSDCSSERFVLDVSGLAGRKILLLKEVLEATSWQNGEVSRGYSTL